MESISKKSPPKPNFEKQETFLNEVICRKERIFVKSRFKYSFGDTKVLLDLLNVKSVDFISYLMASKSERKKSKIHELLKSEHVFYGWDVDSDTMTIKPVHSQSETEAAGRIYMAEKSTREYQISSETLETDPLFTDSEEEDGDESFPELKSEHVFYGWDGDSDSKSFKPVHSQSEAEAVSRIYMAHKSTQESPISSKALKTDPLFMDSDEDGDESFPGLKYTSRSSAGMKVHLPRSPDTLADVSVVKKRRKSSKVKTKDMVEKVPLDSEHFSCCKCDFKVTRQDAELLSLHLFYTHNEKLFFCNQCPDQGSYSYLPGSLRRHMIVKHPGSDKEAFEAHLNSQLRVMNGKYEQTETENVSTNDRFECLICSKFFTSEEKRDWHSNEKHFASSPVTSEEDRVPKAKEIPRELYHIIISPEKKVEFLCLVCLDHFSLINELQSHWTKDHCC